MVLNLLVSFVICSVVLPTTERLIVEGKFLIFVGRSFASFVNEGLES